MTITERCSCGASIMYDIPGFTDTSPPQILEFRTLHIPCRPKPQGQEEKKDERP